MLWCSGVDDLDAVVSTIGGTVTNPKADSDGNINLIEQAVQNGVKKFVLITSIGTGDSKDAPGEEVYNVLKPVLLEKAKAEDALMVSFFALNSICPRGHVAVFLSHWRYFYHTGFSGLARRAVWKHELVVAKNS